MAGQNFVIGIDGGGTKTIIALADIKGKIKKQVVLGPSNPNKVDFNQAIEILGRGIKKVAFGVKRNKIKFIYIALAGSLERDLAKRKKIKTALLKRFPEFRIWQKIIKIEGDQKAAFRSATNKKNGIVLIAGTGSIAIGWNENKEAIAGGWDYILGDQGSAFWLGHKALKQICKELDDRKKYKSLLQKLIFKKWQIKNEADLINKVYTKGYVEKIASLAALVNLAGQKKDKDALNILKNAAQELALAANTVIQKLNFKEKRIPCVLIGGVFQSNIIKKLVKNKISDEFSSVYFISPKSSPIKGAIKLAIENLKQ